MKVRLLFGGRFDLLALAGLLVGLGFSSPAPAQEAPDVVWEVAGTNSVSAVAFSPDGQQVASGGGSQNPTAELWDAADGTALATFPAPSRSGAIPTGIASLDFSPAGLLAVGGLLQSTGYPVPGSAADVWRLADETIVHSFSGGNVSFSDDGTSLLTGGTVREIPSETVVAQVGGGGISSFAFGGPWVEGPSSRPKTRPAAPLALSDITGISSVAYADALGDHDIESERRERIRGGGLSVIRQDHVLEPERRLRPGRAQSDHIDERDHAVSGKRDIGKEILDSVEELKGAESRQCKHENVVLSFCGDYCEDCGEIFNDNTGNDV